MVFVLGEPNSLETYMFRCVNLGFKYVRNPIVATLYCCLYSILIGHPVLCFQYKNGFRMSINILDTHRQHRVPLCFIVLNNARSFIVVTLYCCLFPILIGFPSLCFQYKCQISIELFDTDSMETLYYFIVLNNARSPLLLPCIVACSLFLLFSYCFQYKNECRMSIDTDSMEILYYFTVLNNARFPLL